MDRPRLRQSFRSFPFNPKPDRSLFQIYLPKDKNRRLSNRPKQTDCRPHNLSTMILTALHFPVMRSGVFLQWKTTKYHCRFQPMGGFPPAFLWRTAGVEITN
jgi:hypothetical protein